MADDPELNSDGKVKLWAGSSVEDMLREVARKLETFQTKPDNPEIDMIGVKFIVGRCMVSEDVRSAWLRYLDNIEAKWWMSTAYGFVDLGFRNPVVRSTFISYLSEELAKFEGKADRLTALAIYLAGHRTEGQQAATTTKVERL